MKMILEINLQDENGVLKAIEINKQFNYDYELRSDDYNLINRNNLALLYENGYVINYFTKEYILFKRK